MADNSFNAFMDDEVEDTPESDNEMKDLFGDDAVQDNGQQDEADEDFDDSQDFDVDEEVPDEDMNEDTIDEDDEIIPVPSAESQDKDPDPEPRSVHRRSLRDKLGRGHRTTVTEPEPEVDDSPPETDEDYDEIADGDDVDVPEEVPDDDIVDVNGNTDDLDVDEVDPIITPTQNEPEEKVSDREVGRDAGSPAMRNRTAVRKSDVDFNLVRKIIYAFNFYSHLSNSEVSTTYKFMVAICRFKHIDFHANKDDDDDTKTAAVIKAAIDLNSDVRDSVHNLIMASEMDDSDRAYFLIGLNDRSKLENINLILRLFAITANKNLPNDLSFPDTARLIDKSIKKLNTKNKNVVKMAKTIDGLLQKTRDIGDDDETDQ